MDIFDVLTLVSGLALFLYGMNIMGDALKRSGGNRMKSILASLTSSQFKGFLLGLGVTAIIQSSSATTVMVVGFVNSGVMTLTQTIGVIMGANVGTAVTSWLTGLSGIGSSGAAVSDLLQWFKPSSWTPILAMIGLLITMFAKRDRKKDVGTVLPGFAILMVGMDFMSSAVSGLKESESFHEILTMFSNPILGVLAGLILTAIVQSSSASVGILQTLTTTGAITYGAAIPIVMGQNIGTCVTAMISSIGANKNARRAALIHLYFNIIGVVFWLGAFYLVDLFANFAFVGQTIDMWGVAGVHTVFKILSVALMAPFSKYLEKLAMLTIRESKSGEDIHLLDERLIATPTVAVKQAEEVTMKMAFISCDALRLSLGLLSEYDDKTANEIRAIEKKADEYEDMLGSYLIKLSAEDHSAEVSRSITRLLHVIGDLERISDHAVNLVESAEEIKDKKVVFSDEAQRELAIMKGAVSEILDLACNSFTKHDLRSAILVEPLEQVVDTLRDQIKLHHILRLQKSECSIEHGFVLSDILTNLERVSDHCSNIAGCVLEMSAHSVQGMHQYLRDVRSRGEEYNRNFREYQKKYSLST
jgi:phosphate:Na+ symporter